MMPPPIRQDLVVVCHQELEIGDPGSETTQMPLKITLSELLRVHHDGTEFRADPLALLLGSIELLQTGDVTGDGLDDIVGLRINRDSGPSLVVVPQCASSDLECSPELIAQGEPGTQ